MSNTPLTPEEGSLQSRISELEKEVAYLRGLEKLGDKAIDAYHAMYREEKQLNEKLMGLLEKQITGIVYEKMPKVDEIKKKVWLTYCKQNNITLKSDGDGK